MGVVFSKSLFVKQTFLTLVLAIVLSLVSSAFQFFDGISEQKAQINQHFEELLAVVEKPLSEAVFRLDVAFAQQQVNGLLVSPSISHLEVRDESGRLFVEATAAKRDFYLPEFFTNYFLVDLETYERELHLERPAFYAGNLYLWPEKRYLLDAIFKEQVSVLIYNLFKDVLLACLLSLVFYFLVTYPLMRLTESLSSAGYNEDIPLPKSFHRYHKSDELGNLYTTFAHLWKKLHKALSDLERSDSHSKATIEHAADGILLLDESNKITLVNSTAENMLKMSEDELKSSPLKALHTSSSWPDFLEVLMNLNLGSPQTVEAVYQIQGVELPVEIRLAKYRIQSRVETILLVRDVSERKEAEAHIHRLAYYDSVTNLPNRQYLSDKLLDVLKNLRATKASSHAAVVFMDLDRFKIINDSLGHNVGDQLLCSVASQLESVVKDNIVFARMGGDEFAFLLSHLGDDKRRVEKVIETFIRRVIYACQQVKKAGHHEVHITASLGATIFNGDETSAEAIFKQADTALYRAKESGRNTFALYRTEMQAISDMRLEMEKALHHATEAKLFELYYQPQTNDKNQLIGAEALIRWKDEHKGFISPAVFIPIAEEIGLIVEIGQWVLDESLSQVATWLKEGKWDPSWRMSINVSPIQFQQAGFLPMLKEQLEKHEVPSSCVDLEITENMLFNDLNSSLEKMHAIKRLGVHLSIDDFGTGYSSLKYLKSLPIDRLKIDQSFIRDLLTDKSDEAIVLAVIAMAKALNINVLAEGVETLVHFDRLHEMGCFYYQGYYFGHPVPPKEFIAQFVHDLPTQSPSS
ncbi:PAS domain S-box-containing protein/diguanylate cyclase (GGDEF)-like protein [Marinomonas alcarazii]|uniref:PAS domain S-box-containing protein/diguanylate cyclase (GGDEF)-like protein n=1 Tax=Marinomonas alcarazii TaxID=491949 RepID=A0A318V5G3_9GAMM|nr:bifunctional diguanylate cyclase/phosphodiesterase [Marinomonas alcarazii]PYF84012.1 PAS domain S-box-containing protein/diguanylate cyclase (GGDEF)-like protein [Marinomonas alcarazii]